MHHSTPARRMTTAAVPATTTTDASVPDACGALSANIQQVIQGKPEAVRLAVVCLLAGGHLLIEDVPGLGKTSLARSLARSIDGAWRRIQFTPDLLPSDVTGVTIYNQGTGKFEFHPGPVFANVVLADELNRATPKTQAALLEVMEELRVTVDGQPYDLTPPFMVIATQNPIDMDGTYRLPEAQLDRFLMRISMGYPDHDAEVRVLNGERAGVSPDDLPAVIQLPEVERLIEEAHAVRVDPEISSYAVRLAAATRKHPLLRLGASPRATLGLIKAARAWAFTAGRSYVTPDDLKAVALTVFSHRLIVTPDAEIQGRSSAEVVEQVLREVPVPQGNAVGVGVGT